MCVIGLVVLAAAGASPAVALGDDVPERARPGLGPAPVAAPEDGVPFRGVDAPVDGGKPTGLGGAPYRVDDDGPRTPDVAPDGGADRRVPDAAERPRLPGERAGADRLPPHCPVRSDCDASGATALPTKGGSAPSEAAPPDSTSPSGRLLDDPAMHAVAAGAGVGVLAALLYLVRGGLAAAGWRMWALLAVRREPNELDGHPVRSAILRHLDAQPGATTRELAKVAGVSYRRVVYHLGMLERGRRLRIRTVGRKRLHFAADAPRVHDEDLQMRALVDPATATGRILLHVAHAPGPSLSRIARTFGLSAGNTHYHVQRLREAGLLYTVRHGPRIRHYLSDKGRAWAMRLMPVPHDAADPSPAGGRVARRSSAASRGVAA